MTIELLAERELLRKENAALKAKIEKARSILMGARANNGMFDTTVQCIDALKALEDTSE